MGVVNPTRCAYCGDDYDDHTSRDGTLLTAYAVNGGHGFIAGACNAYHRSGGIAGSLQRCGCRGYEPKESAA